MSPQKPSVRAGSASHVGRARSSCPSACGIGQVAGEQVEQGRDVGGALDAGVPAQGHDAAARPADVAQQQLQDRPRCGCTARRRCAASSRPRRRQPVVRSRPGVRRSPASPPARNSSGGMPQTSSHHLRGVAGEVPLAGSGRRTAGAAASRPGPGRAPRLRRAARLAAAARRTAARVVAPGSGSRRSPVAAAADSSRPRTARSRCRRCRSRGSKPENSPSRSSVSGSPRVEQRGRRWCSRTHVVAEVPLVAQDVVDDAAEEGDVATRPAAARAGRPPRWCG